MIINFTDLQIIEDENQDKILFEGSDSDPIPQNYYNNPKTLMVFKKGYIQLFSSFRYTSNNQQRMYRGPDIGAPFAAADAFFPVEESYDNTLDPSALSWLQHFFSQVESRPTVSTNERFKHKKMFENSITGSAYQGSVTYEQVGFAYRVAKILGEKFEECVGVRFTQEQILRKFDSILLKCQMPWLNDLVNVNEPIQVSSRGLGLDRYVKYLLGPSLQDNINKFFKEHKIPSNKRLKKIIFSQVYKKHTKREIYQPNTLANGEGPILRIRNGIYNKKEVQPDGSVVFEVTQHFINSSILKDTMWMSKCLPIDCISDILEENENYPHHEDHFVIHEGPQTWDFLNLFSLPKRKRLINESRGQHYLRDTINQWQQYSLPESIPPKLRDKYPTGMAIPKFQTVKELHDKISAQYNEIKAEEQNRDIEYTMEEMKLHNAEKDGVRIVLPSEGSVVVKWGKELGHCIASYIERAAKKDIMLLGIYVNDELTYNAEIQILSQQDIGQPVRNYKKKYLQDIEDPCCDIRQLRGLRNKDAEPKHREIVKELIDEWLSNLVSDRTEHSRHSDLLQAQ